MLASTAVDQHSWVLYGDDKSWFNARQSCITKGGHLAAINSNDEDILVRAMMGNNTSAWLGGHDLTSEGTFRWVTNEEFENHDSASAPVWGVSEPNNSYVAEGNEHCVHYYQNLPTNPIMWNDAECSGVTHYICEFNSGASDSGETLTNVGLRPCGGIDICMDACGVVGGDGSSCAGCDGIPNSNMQYDVCGVCGGDGTTCNGCDGIPNSGLVIDACGECGGTCYMGCDNQINGLQMDPCEVCGGDGSSCRGCDGIQNSGAVIDSCDVCGGDGTSCLEN